MEILEVLSEIVTCKEYPKIVADHYMCDFSGKKEDDVLMSEGMECMTRPKDLFIGLRVRASSCRRLNDIYHTIRKHYQYEYNELKYKETSTRLQSKYVEYFSEKYPNCQFYTSAKKVYPVAVRLNKKLVGIIMPLIW
jgi:hypothetical protein